MRHLVSGRKLGRTSSHRKALLDNLATELFRHKSIKTTEAKAKELRPFAETLITRAKNALLKEKQGGLPTGHTIDVHSRRIVAKHIRVKDVLSELFDSIAPAVAERNGGYTRVIKTGIRQGDSARTAIIELVDFSAPQDGVIGLKKKRKPTSQKPKTTAPAPALNPVVEVPAVIAPVEFTEAEDNATAEAAEVENLSVSDNSSVEETAPVQDTSNAVNETDSEVEKKD